MSLNTDPAREEYSLLTNNCMHFVKQTLEAAGVNTPIMIDPRPNSYIDELSGLYTPVSYDPQTGQTRIGATI